MKVGELTIDMALNIARMQRDLDQAKRTIDRGFQSMGRAAQNFAGIIAGAFAVDSIFDFAKAQVIAARELDAYAKALGMSVTTLGEMQSAFADVGLDAEKTADILKDTFEKIADALATGGGEAMDALKMLGLSVREIGQVSPDQQLFKIAEGLSRIGTQGEKVFILESLANDASRLLPLLDNNATKLRELMAASEGRVMDDADVAALTSMEASFREATAESGALGRSLLTSVAPVLKDLADFASDLARGIRESAESLRILPEPKYLDLPGATAALRTAETVQAEIAQAQQAIDTLMQLHAMAKAAGDTVAASMHQQTITAVYASMARLSEELAQMQAPAEEVEQVFRSLTVAEQDLLDKLLPADKAAREQAAAMEMLQAVIAEVPEHADTARRAIAALSETQDDSATAIVDTITPYNTLIATADDYVAAVWDEVDVMTAAESERQALRDELELERIGIARGSEQWEQYTAILREARQAQSDYDATQAASAEAERQREQMLADVRSAQDALVDLAIGGEQAFERLGETIKREVLTLLIRMTTTRWMVGVTATGAAGAAAAAGGIGTADSLGGLSALQSLASLYQATGGIGASIGYGTAVGSQQSAMLAAQESGMVTMAGTLGPAAQMLGGALVGFMAGKMISGGYSAMGDSGNQAVVAGTAIGAMIAGPLGAGIGGAIGGLVNRAFGRKLADTGITGTLGGEGAFSGSSFTYEKGGWFRGNKTSYGALDSGTVTAFQQQAAALQDGAWMMAATIGTASDSIYSYTKSIKLSLMGLTEEQQAKKIQAAFDSYAESLARIALGTSRYTRDGETAVEALTRLSSALVTVNNVLPLLRQRMLDISLAGADAASALVDMFGGIERFGEVTDTYYQALYTDVERAEDTISVLSETLTALGVRVIPQTAAEYRQLADAQNLATESGRAIWSVMVEMGAAFVSATDTLTAEADRLAAEVQAAADAMAAALDQMASDIASIQSQRVQLASAILDERDALETRLLTAMGAEAALRERELALIDPLNRALAETVYAAEDMAAALTEAADKADALAGAGESISDYIRELMGASGTSYQDTLTLAQGGDVEASQRIVSDAQAYLADIERQATTSIEAARARAMVAADLTALPAVQSYDQQQIELLKSIATNTSSTAVVSAIESLSFADRVHATGVLRALSAIDTTADGIITADELAAAGLALDDSVSTLLTSDQIAALGLAADATIGGLLTLTQMQGLGLASATDITTLSTTLASALSAIDTTADGIITAQELADAGLALDSSVGTLLTSDQISALGLAADATVGNLLTLTQLTTLGLATSGDLTTLGTVIGTAFDAIDVDASGFLTADELTTALSGIATDATITSVIDALDANGDGQLSELEAIGGYTSDTVTGVDATIDALRELVGETELNSVRLTSLNSTLEALLSHYDTVAAEEAATQRAAAEEAAAQAQAAAARAAAAAAEAERQALWQQGIDRFLDRMSGAVYDATSTEILGDDLAARLVSAGGRTQTTSNVAYGQSLESMIRAINSVPNATYGTTADDYIDALRAAGVDLSMLEGTLPQFADGGMHSGGLRLVGERGPELEVTGPARYWSAEDTAAMLRPRSDTSYSAMLAELQALRSEVSELRIEARATATNTGKSRRLLERVTRDGEAMQTETLA